MRFGDGVRGRSVVSSSCSISSLKFALFIEDNKHYSACPASAVITDCVRKILIRQQTLAPHSQDSAHFACSIGTPCLRQPPYAERARREVDA